LLHATRKKPAPLEPFRNEVKIATKSGFDLTDKGGLNSRPDHIKRMVAGCLANGSGLAASEKSFLAIKIRTKTAGLLLDSALQMSDLSANEGGLTPTKYV
jgi:hypothetical protein